MKTIKEEFIGMPPSEFGALVDSMADQADRMIGTFIVETIDTTPEGVEIEFTSDKGNGKVKAALLKGFNTVSSITVLISHDSLHGPMMETWQLIQEALETKRQKEGIYRKITQERKPRQETLDAIEGLARLRAENESAGKLVYTRQKAMLEVGISRNTWKDYDRKGYDNWNTLPVK